MATICHSLHILPLVIFFSLFAASKSHGIANASDHIADSLPTGVHMASSDNPLRGHNFYVNPYYQRLVMNTMNSVPTQQKNALRKLLNKPTAIWLATKSLASASRPSPMRTALANAARRSNPPLVTFVVYNLPNRDCAAEASGGEICCSYLSNGKCNMVNSGNNCANGLREYKEQFIDAIATNARQYCGRVPMAFILEPDSLPNLITNLHHPSCRNAGTTTAYREGIKYAATTINSACPSAPIYLDAAQGLWLGWETQARKFIQEIARLRIHTHLRGFAINVSNYQEQGRLCPRVGFCNDATNRQHACCQESCGLVAAGNGGHTVMNYAAELRALAHEEIAGFTPHMVVDTSRNGRGGRRRTCATWCNARYARAGVAPSAFAEEDWLVDAYLWIKPPGESDGCTRILPDGRACPSFDTVCASAESIGSRDGEPRAPVAGAWFAYQAVQIASG